MGFYYLNSRYYDPGTGRFISVDDLEMLFMSDDLYNKNLYAYCDNNPTARIDLEGMFWQYAIACGVINALSEIVTARLLGDHLDFTEIGYAFSVGAISSLGTGFGQLCAGINFLSIVGEGMINGENFWAVFAKGGISLFCSAFSIGGMAKKVV